MKTRITQAEVNQHVAIAEKLVTTNTNVHTSKAIGKTSYQDWKSQKIKMVLPSDVATTMLHIGTLLQISTLSQWI